MTRGDGAERDSAGRSWITLTFQRVAPVDRLLLFAVLICLASWSMLLVTVALARGLGRPGLVSSGLVILAGLLTYGWIAAAVYVGSQRPGWKYGRIARSICIFLTATAALTILSNAYPDTWADVVSRLAAATVLAICIVLAVGEARSRPLSVPACVAAGLVPALLLIVEAAVQPEMLEFSVSFSSAAEMDADPTLSGFVMPLALMSPAYLLLGAAAWALFTVRTGLAISRPLGRSTIVVATLLAAKLLWLITAITRVAPEWLQGRRRTWDAVRGDGGWSWLLAGLLAAVLVGCVILLDQTNRRQVRRRGQLRRREFGRGQRGRGRFRRGGNGSGRGRARRDREQGPALRDQRLAATRWRGLRERIANWWRRLNSPEPTMVVGLERAEGVIRVVIWTVAAPSLVVTFLVLFQSAEGSARSAPGAVAAGASLALAAFVPRTGLPVWARWTGSGLLVVGAIALAVPPLQLPDQVRSAGPWWVGYATAIQQNYVFLPGVAGFAALVVAAVLGHRLWTARRHRGRVWRQTTLSFAASALWVAVLLPVGLFFLVPLIPSFPLVLPPPGSFHIFNLLPTREDVAGTSLLLGDPAPERVQPGWAGPGGTFESATFDAALTIGLVGYLLVTARGPLRRSPYGNAMVLMLLATSTFVAHSATLSPVSWGRGSWLYLAMVFPAAYEILFNSRAASRQPGSLFALVTLSTTAVATLGALAVTSRTFLTTGVPLDSTLFGYARHFGPQFYVYAFALTYLVLALVHWRRTRPPAEAQPRPLPTRQVAPDPRRPWSAGPDSPAPIVPGQAGRD